MPDDGGRLPWRHRISLRLRITLITAVVVAAVLALGGVLILLALRDDVIDHADQAIRARAAGISALAAEGNLPTPLPRLTDPESFAVVMSDGRTVRQTRGMGVDAGFGLPEQEIGQVDVYRVAQLPLDGSGPYRVVARGVDTPWGPATVYVATSVAHLDQTMGAAVRNGIIGVVLLVLVLATVTWLAIGRALAPVEAIRARADAITGHNLDQRVPVPVQHDEIGRLARTVNQMLGRLQHSADMQRRFVADAAHELRSPITSLRVQLETARDGDGTAGREGDMLHETVRMEGLVDQLLVLARADAETAWVRPETVDLDDLIDSAVTSLGSRDGILVDTTGVQPVQLDGDPGLLEQVVRNLVHNALGHAQGVVRVSASTVEDRLAVLAVEDDGPGVPEDRREDVFDRFVRLEVSRDREHGGVGLGLAIVAEIVRAHGGRVHADDSPLGGARFVVELPLDAAEPSA